MTEYSITIHVLHDENTGKTRVASTVGDDMPLYAFCCIGVHVLVNTIEQIVANGRASRDEILADLFKEILLAKIES